MLNNIYSILKVVLLLALLFSLWPPGTAFAGHESVAITITSGPLGFATQFFGSEDAEGAPPPRFWQTGPVTGELVYVGQLCDGDLVENAAALGPGDIAVIRRGFCFFTEKILNAQALGAGAAVIANERPDGPVINWIADSPEAITIPALFISTADGDAIAASPTGNFATIDALPLEQVIQNLINEEVEELVTAGVLNQGQANALTAKLEAAIQKVSQGNSNAATNQLKAFIKQVNALIKAGVLSQAEGQLLIDPANGFIDQLSG